MADTDTETIDETPETETPPAVEDTNDDDIFDKERAMRTIRALREEVKAGKASIKTVADLETRLLEIENANKTEEQLRAERLAELEKAEQARASEVQGLRLKLAVHERASTLGIADPTLAVAAITGPAVEWADGEPTNLDDILADVLERHPALKTKTEDEPTPSKRTTAGTDSGTGRGSGKGPTLTADELEAAKAMGIAPERYAALRGKRSVAEMRTAISQLET